MKAQYYLKTQSGIEGPFSAREIGAMECSGSIQEATLIANGTDGDWLPLKRHPEIVAALGEDGASPHPKNEQRHNAIVILLLAILAWMVGYPLFERYEKKRDAEAAAESARARAEHDRTERIIQLNREAWEKGHKRNE